MVRGFTPIIGLAVVVALALAAVVGAMSLANPAHAQAAPMLRATGSPNQINLRWTYGDTTAITGWQVLYTDEDGASSGWVAITSNLVTSAAPTYTGQVTGLENGVEYRVRVRGLDNTDQDPLTRSNQVIVIPNSAPTGTVSNIQGEAVSAGVELSWSWSLGSGSRAITGWQYAFEAVADTLQTNIDGSTATWMDMDGATGGSRSHLVEFDEDGLQPASNYVFSIRALAGTVPQDGSEAAGYTAVSGAVMTSTAPASFDSTTDEPADVGRYTFEIPMATATNTLINDLVIELEDFDLPPAVGTQSVVVTTPGCMDIEGATAGAEASRADNYTFTPEDVAVDGSKLLISIGDITEDTAGTGTDRGGIYSLGGPGNCGDDGVVGGDGTAADSGARVVTVVVRETAGIRTPTEAGTYFANIEFGDIKHEYDENAELPGSLEIEVVRVLSLDEGDGGLDTEVEATGKGFKNDTSLTVFRDAPILVMYDDDDNPLTPWVRLPAANAADYKDKVGNVPAVYVDDDDMALTYVTMADSNGNPVMYATAPNGRQDSDDDTLCLAPKIGGNDVGTCQFKVTHPTFTGGFNYVNARDGRSNFAKEADIFELTASISASPDTGSPGERILVQVVDFPANSSIVKAELARNVLAPVCTGCGSVDGAGAGTFSFIIPNWPSAGIQELRVFGTNDVKASKNVTIIGPQITATPNEVLANQRISLVGTGFSPGSVIANADDDLGQTDPVVAIGGKTITGDRINDGQPVRVDNGGNWSASVDLPLAEATTAAGTRLIRVTDSRNRSGGVEVTIPDRSVSITPDSGRVGTIALIEGRGFPSKNDEGNSFNVEIVYETASGQTTVSATPDASGRFEVQLRIPTTAAIPSSNTVKVSFVDGDGVTVPMTIPHNVPEGVINLSNTIGGPGSTVGVKGEGFKSFVPISSVKIGNIDITPAPKPSTDVNGMMEFEVLIPGLDVGIQTIEVQVGQTTSSVGFTVIQSGINPGDITPVAEALEDLGENLDSVWHFNNDTKAWNFYDGLEGSDLTHLITGETYLLQIKSDQEVILNRDTRNLTCVGGNCWNQIVW